MLKTALPTTPLTPMSSLVTKSPMVLVASSGALEPAAMKVAPATSGESPSADIERGQSDILLFYIGIVDWRKYFFI